MVFCQFNDLKVFREDWEIEFSKKKRKLRNLSRPRGSCFERNTAIDITQSFFCTKLGYSSDVDYDDIVEQQSRH